MSRKFRVIVSAFSVIVVVVLSNYFFSRHASAVSQNGAKPEAQTAQPAANPVATKDLPPGTIVDKPKASTLPVTIAHKYLDESSYMTVAEFQAAIRDANSGKSSFKKDEEVLVPGIEPQPVVEKNRPYPKDEEIRAIYLTGTTSGSAHGIELIRRWKDAGGNAVVFDIKDSDGSLNITFENPLSP